MNLRSSVTATIALSLGVAYPASAGDRYYMMIFGQQTEPVTPRLTHTSALFVKSSGDKDDPNERQLEFHTISWMPRSLGIRVMSLRPEPGINLSVEDSIKWANSVGAGTWMWGPHEVKKELYDMAARQAALLNAGQMSYICIDRRFRGGSAINCIHAVSDLDTTQRLLSTGTQCGNAGSSAVRNHLSRWALPIQESNRWLVEKMGLNRADVQLMSPEAQPPAKESSTAAVPVQAVPVARAIRVER